MQDSSWHDLVDTVFPENQVTEYLRDEPRRHVVLTTARQFGKDGTRKSMEQGVNLQAERNAEREFLASVGMKRKPVGVK